MRQSDWQTDQRPYDLYICIWIKSSNRALLLLNKKEIYTFAFIPAAQRFHSWNPNKTASMNIVMTCFVCSEAWAGPERNWLTLNVLCSCGNRFNQMFIEFIEYELHICAFSGKLVSWKHSEFEKLKHFLSFVVPQNIPGLGSVHYGSIPIKKMH